MFTIYILHSFEIHARYSFVTLHFNGSSRGKRRKKTRARRTIISNGILNGVQSYISVYLYKSPLKIEENARLSDPCHNRRENFHLAEIDPRMRRRKRSRENLEVGKENRGDIYLEAARVVYGQPSLDYNFKSTTSWKLSTRLLRFRELRCLNHYLAKLWMSIMTFFLGTTDSVFKLAS